MRDKTKVKRFSSERRQKRIRKKVRGTPEKPRLMVFKSLNHISVQLIDDLSHRSLIGASSLTPSLKKGINKDETKTQIAKKVGLYLASIAKEKGIVQVVFDRNRYVYHGRIKALAEGAREGGLKF